MDVVALAVELGQLALEVCAHVPHDLLHALQVSAGEHRMPELGNENQVGVQGENTVPTGSYVSVLGHEPMVG
ncbi:hypothetical protein Acsp04_55700 [Actinomadura sp. NBRC 104425]|nr:hypothetical protein Acsp04_55700 [Actinomadura sp. NBRC 104425]